MLSVDFWIHVFHHASLVLHQMLPSAVLATTLSQSNAVRNLATVNTQSGKYNLYCFFEISGYDPEESVNTRAVGTCDCKNTIMFF